MPQLTLEEIRRRSQKLPQPVKDLYHSPETGEVLREIGKRHGLHIDELGELVDETGLIMLGVTHPSEYIGNLAERIEIDREKAKAIAKDVNSEIFEKIRDELKRLHTGEKAPVGQANESAAPVPPKRDTAEEAPAGIDTRGEKIAADIQARQASAQPAKKESAKPASQETPTGQEASDAPEEEKTRPASPEPSPTQAPIQEANEEPEEQLNREEVLREIESPTPPAKKEEPTEREKPAAPSPQPAAAPTASGQRSKTTLAEEKLRQPTNTPRAESTYLAKPGTAQKEGAEEEGEYGTSDPYREPI